MRSHWMSFRRRILMLKRFAFIIALVCVLCIPAFSQTFFAKADHVDRPLLLLARHRRDVQEPGSRVRSSAADSISNGCRILRVVMLPRENAALESKTLPDVLYSDVSSYVKVRRAGEVLDVGDVVTELNKTMGGYTPGLRGGGDERRQNSTPFPTPSPPKSFTSGGTSLPSSASSIH